MRRPGWLTGVALGCLGVSTAQASALDDYVRVQVGSFTSEAQAKQDARYDVVTWHIVEIWMDDDPDERWLYTESWMPDSPAPYMQRISRLRQEADGTLSARRYTLPEAPRYVGAWQEPSRFADLKPAGLAELHGCDAVITRAGTGRFEGSTSGARCRNSFKGASYTISQSVVAADEMINWDRGFDAAGNLVWGPTAGGYRFRRVGETGTCVQPVRMLVYGEIRDRKAFGAYVRAIAAAGLYAKTGGYYEAMSPALEVFEGASPPERGVVIARFPCLAAARQFWYSPEYAEIRKLREGIADFEVLVLPVPPIPK
jgi:uncharacterized protein (DUF1330 family)